MQVGNKVLVNVDAINCEPLTGTELRYEAKLRLMAEQIGTVTAVHENGLTVEFVTFSAWRGKKIRNVSRIITTADKLMIRPEF